MFDTHTKLLTDGMIVLSLVLSLVHSRIFYVCSKCFNSELVTDCYINCQLCETLCSVDILPPCIFPCSSLFMCVSFFITLSVPDLHFILFSQSSGFIAFPIPMAHFVLSLSWCYLSVGVHSHILFIHNLSDSHQRYAYHINLSVSVTLIISVICVYSYRCTYIEVNFFIFR
jgi:hypothetical protein